MRMRGSAGWGNVQFVWARESSEWLKDLDVAVRAMGRERERVHLRGRHTGLHLQASERQKQQDASQRTNQTTH